MESIRKKILIAGGTGLVGSALISSLNKEQYDIFVLSRTKRQNKDGLTYLMWNPEIFFIESTINADIIINLAGSGIADKRWTEKRKKDLISSRTDSAATIKKMLDESGHKPNLYLSASAVGFYGDRQDELLSETSKCGEGFMADCCEQWEAAAKQLESNVARVVILRIGLVLSKEGGALPKMIMTARARIFNYFGNGQQYYPWIHIDDLIGIIHHVITEKNIAGTWNAVAPQSERNIDLMRIVRNNYPSPSLLISAPAFALKLILGEMSKVILNSNNVSVDKLLKSGYTFKYSNAVAALRDLLKN